jgi:thioredoxin-dependent peroxiredoxin
MTLKDILNVIFKRRRGRMLNVGDRAPAFDLLDHAGKRRKLSDFKGQTVVLWFYPKADTPG